MIMNRFEYKSRLYNSTLKEHLSNVKLKQKEVKKGIVYQIPCTKHEYFYVGGTGRTFTCSELHDNE